MATKCNSGLTNDGKYQSSAIINALAVGVAAINTAAATYIAAKQWDIANKYFQIAKWWRDYYNSTYKPLEDLELNEAYALKDDTPIYDTAIGRHKTYGRLQFKGVAEKSMQCTSEYCTGLRSALLKDTLNSEAAAVAALANLGYRNERAYIEARSDVYWKRKIAVMNRGRDNMADGTQFAQLSFGIFGDLGKQAGAGAAGAVEYLGYTWNRNKTKVPMVARGALVDAPSPTKPTKGPTVLTSGHEFDQHGNEVL